MRRLLAVTLAFAAGGAVLGVAPPAPRPARADEEEDDDGPPPGPSAAPDAPKVDDAALRERLGRVVHVPSFGLTDGVITLAYPLAEPVELRAFEASGWDKVDVRNVQGQAQSGVGMELGAGSRNVGRLLHRLALQGDVEINVELWIAHNTPSAVICFLLNDKVGALWGQQLVRPSNMRPFGRSAPPDVLLFKEERMVRSRIVVRGDEVVVTCQGSESSRHTFDKGELRSIRFGIIARNVRFVLRGLQLRGTVDASKL
ncbi:MAG: hypothetical protein M9894_03340 [Planctomycetes bacterium]|nr:hypothetical protein [Planctomycetota bacterium]